MSVKTPIGFISKGALALLLGRNADNRRYPQTVLPEQFPEGVEVYTDVSAVLELAGIRAETTVVEAAAGDGEHPEIDHDHEVRIAFMAEIAAKGFDPTIEKLLVHALLWSAITKHGFSVSVEDGMQGDGEIVVQCCRDIPTIEAAMFSTDADTLHFFKEESDALRLRARVGWTILIYGNGTDLISDYSTKTGDLIGPLMGEIIELAEKLDGRGRGWH